MSKASISVELNDDSSEVTISGTYENVINAICAGLKGLIANMMEHPKYIEIQKNSKLTEEDFEQELIYSVMLNVMDRLENHYVLSMGSITNDELLTDITDNLNENNMNMDIDCDGFEQFLNNSNKEDNGEE
jgi:hypothetical protein